MSEYTKQYQVGRKIEFNTGREYTEFGQRIKAVIIDFIPEAQETWREMDFFNTYIVRFDDLDRMISGLVIIDNFTQQCIMEAYDACDYELL